MGFHLRSWQKICASSTYLNSRWQMNAYEMNDHAIYWTQKVNFNSLIEQKQIVVLTNWSHEAHVLKSSNKR